ncbi:MAG: glycosyl hydrolase family 18 protein [Chloroflexota bacterium]
MAGSMRAWRRLASLCLCLVLVAASAGCLSPATVATPTSTPPPTALAEAATPSALPATPTDTATATATVAATSAPAFPSATALPLTPTLPPSATAVASAPTSTRGAIATPTKAPATATATRAAIATRAVTATAVPTATVAPTATPASAPRPSSGRVFLGYYVPYDPSSWRSLQAQAANLDYVALQVATFDYCGGISSREDRTLQAFARARGLPVLASVFTNSEPLNHTVLTNPTARANAVQQVARFVVEAGYDGVDLDLEAVPATDRQALTAFVAQVSAAVRQQGKMVVMAVPAKARDATTGWAGAYDYAALAPHVDLVVIMSYGYTTSSSTTPGSTAPYSWVEQVAAFATSQFPAHKVLLGVGLWAYDWNTTAGGRAKALRYPQAAALAAAYGAPITLDPVTRSAKFSYTARAGDALPYQESLPPISHDLVERRPASCPLGPPPPTTPVPRTPTATPPGAAVQNHTVWLENAAAVSAKLDIVSRYGAGGAAGWRLGQEDPASWPIIAAWRR